MVEVLVEINGFNSLEKIDSSFTEKLLGNIKSMLENDPSVFYKRIGSCFLFGFSPGINDLNRLIHTILRMYDYLGSVADELRGFNILVNQTKGILSKIEHEAFVKDIYTLEPDGSLFVSKSAADLFEGYSAFEEAGGYLRMVSYENLQIKAEGGALDFVIKTKEQEEFTASFTPLLNGERKGLFFFHNPEMQGILYMGYALSRYIEGSGENKAFLPWFYIFPEKNDFSGYSALIRSFNYGFLSDVPRFLSLTEGKEWEELYRLIHPEYSIMYEDDAVLLFRLYLSAYGRYFKSMNFPPIVYIFEIDKMEEPAVDSIAEVIEELSAELSLIPVIFSGKQDIPACFQNFNSIKYSFGKDESAQPPVSQYHSFLLREQKDIKLAAGDAANYLLGELDLYSRRLLSLTFLLDGLFDLEEIIDFLCDDDSDRMKYLNVYKNLVSYGYIYPDRMKCVFPGLVSKFNELKSDFGEKILERIFGCYHNRIDIDPQIHGSLSMVFEFAGNLNRMVDSKLTTVHSLIDRNNTEAALPLIKEMKKLLKKRGLEGSYQDIYTDVLFLKAALSDSRIPLVNDLIQKLNAVDNVKNDRVSSILKATLAEAYYSVYEYQKALRPAKDALLITQRAGLAGEESGINTLLGKIMLGMQRIEEAKDYFRISMETATPGSGKFLLAETYYLGAVTYYIYGNLSQSMRLLEKSLDLSRETGRRNWEIIALFAKGRINFDLGRYQSAINVFSECLSVARIYNSLESHEIIYPWIARSFVYSGKREAGGRILENYQESAEGAFFYSEYLYFKGLYSEAEDMVNLSLEMDSDNIHLFLSPDFKLDSSGFKYMEDLVFLVMDGRGVLSHLLRAFSAYLSVLNDNPVKGIPELERLTRDDKLSDIDPFNGLYYFFHALSLPEKEGVDSLDRLTMLSKALRHVQTVASRIDFPKERMAFLTGNYWNSRLMTAAKKNKLL